MSQKAPCGCRGFQAIIAHLRLPVPGGSLPQRQHRHRHEGAARSLSDERKSVRLRRHIALVPGDIPKVLAILP
jgi:hypothetical protein